MINQAMVINTLVVPMVLVLIISVIAYLLGFRKTPTLADSQAAALIVQQSLIGFKPSDAILSADHRAALVNAADGRIALVRPHGDRWVARIVDGAQTQLSGESLTIRLDEPMFSPVSLALGGNAAHWAKILGAKMLGAKS